MENYGCLVKSAPSRSQKWSGNPPQLSQSLRRSQLLTNPLLFPAHGETSIVHLGNFLFVVVIGNVRVGEMNPAAVDIENLPFLQSGFMYLKVCGISIRRYPQLGSSLLIFNPWCINTCWNLELGNQLFFCIKILRVCRYSSVGRLSPLPKSASNIRDQDDLNLLPSPRGSECDLDVQQNSKVA